MSDMAKCLRFALSATNKLVHSNTGTHIPQSALLRLTSVHAAATRQLSAAVAWPLARRSGVPTLAAVKPCTCTSRRLLQTEVDKELSKFLEKEISHEEQQAGKTTEVKGVEGFQVAINDADITLTRKSGSETVVVKFNINSTVDSEQAVHADGQEGEAEMVCRPPFTIEICKGDGNTLSMQCTYTSLEEMEQGGPQDADAIVDSFEIQEVALHKGEWKDTVYSVSAEIMDGNLYDLLMDMLDERGINDEFSNQLIEFSTSYEHTRYLSFLKTLKTFVEK